MKLRGLSITDILTLFSISFIWLAAVIDPVGNVYGLRYISYAFCISTVFFVVVKKRFRVKVNSYQLGFMVVFGFALPLYGLSLFSIFDTGAELTDTSYIAAATISIITVLYHNERAFEFGIFGMIFAGYILALIICTNAIFVLVFNDFTIPSFFVRNGVALIGYRSYGAFQVPYIYFFASPLLITITAYYCQAALHNRSLFNISSLLLVIIATILTGTRASALFGFLTIILILFSERGEKNTKIIAGLFIGILAAYFIVKNFNGILSVFSLQEGSNSSKISDLTKYATLFDGVRTIIFGQGFNAHTWSPVFQIMVGEATRTELTYFEILRVFGLPFGFFIISFLFLLAFRAYRAEKYLGITFFVLLLNASLNPYLFSTNGMLPIGLIIASLSYRGNHQNAKRE